MDNSNTEQDIVFTALIPPQVEDVVRIYEAAFPVDGIGALGTGVLRKYFSWALTGPQAGGSVGASCGGRLVGFALLTHGDPRSGFIRRHMPLIAWNLLRRPWLLPKAGLSTVFRRMLPVRSAPVAAAPEGNSIYLFLIGVDPSFQRRGVGSMILNRCEDIARGKGCSHFILNVDPRNRSAISAYDRNGWERVIEEGVWKGRMRKVLDPISRHTL